MAWVKITDDFYDHPKFLDLTDSAVALWVKALAWSNRYRTGGLVPPSAVNRLGGSDIVVAELIASDLWHDHEDGWLIHDYREYQPDPKEIDARREAKQRAGRAGGIASGKTRASKQGSKPEADASSLLEAKRSPGPDPARTRPVVGTDLAGEEKHVALFSPDETEANPARKTKQQEQFDAFWESYPVKKGKGAARRAWPAAVRKATVPVLMDAVRGYVEDPAREPQYTLHPASWLNGEHWLDERTPPKTKVARETGTPNRGRGVRRGTLAGVALQIIADEQASANEALPMKELPSGKRRNDHQVPDPTERQRDVQEG